MVYLRLLRVKHWIKNTFIFIPAFFSGIILEEQVLTNLLTGLVAFSFVASFLYILNDFRDIENDKKHPKKKHRPLASGEVRPGLAFFIGGLLLIAAGFIAFHLGTTFLIILSTYLVLNILYSLGLKNISILDIVIVSLGFLLRITAGGELAGVPVSQWLMIMIFLLSLLMAVAKRRDDVLMYNNSGEVMRKAILSYNLEFTNVLIPMISSVILVAYIMYSISPVIQEKYHSDKIYITSFFVMLGIFRYLQITMVEKKSGSPTSILYRDHFIILTVLGYILSFVYIIYF